MHDRLMQAIRAVRNRWRLRVALRGLAVVVSAGLALALLSLWGMDRLRFAPAAVTVLRALVYLALIALAWWFLVRPLRRRVDDGRVALYLEEHEPALSGQVAGAVEFGGDERAGTSVALVQRLVSRALERLDAPGGITAIERPAMVRSAMVLGGAALVTAMLAVFQPSFVRGAGFLLPLPGAGTAPYWIAVQPGDTILARGADLTITAELHNFTAERVELAVRRGAGGDWERWDMPADEATGRRALILFALDSTTTYFVEAGGVRTPPHTIDVRDLPYVRALSLEIRPPAYAGQTAIRQDEGDVAALPGSRVIVTVTPTLAPSAGALVFDDGDTIPLAGGPGAMTAAFVVRREGGYRVHLAGADARLLPASAPYLVTLLEDLPPLVTIARPGRDVTATSIEELFTEVRAADDYGVQAVELVYAVNGAPERTVRLHRGTPRRDVTAGHTFYLEEYALSPGDVVAYFARAADARPGARPASSDIYFVTIRPFERSFREAEQGQQQGQGQGQGEDDVGQLSQRQREIVAATFNLVRDSARYTPEEFRQNMATLALAQGRLREEVATLAGRLVSRGVAGQDSSFRQIADILPRAVSEMQSAETSLGRRDAAGALPSEQRALQLLQRAETIFRRDQQVARGQGGGGGGGPQGDPELSELFELDLDRMRNQYEQVQRGQREQASREVDETLERLRELARRQQQEMERRQAAARQGGAAGPAGNAQRQLADEAAEMARRLERLSREQQQPELAEAARRLQQAADAMRRAGADRSGGQAASALDRLRDARRQLEQNRSAGLERDVRALADRARRLAQQQQDVEADVGRLGADGDQARAERIRRLLERKEQMAAEVAGITSDLDRLGREARSDQPEASRQLREAATAVREGRLEDKIRFSRGVVQGRDTEYARNFEEIIGSDIARLERQLQAASGAIGEGREQRLGRALDRAGDLASAMESMGRRAGQEADSAEAGRSPQGRQDQRGQQGQEGRQGQGQPGRQGQQGQQGRLGQGGDRAGGDVRQMRSELSRRRAELDSLRGRLAREGLDVAPLDEIGRAMGRMDRALAAGALDDVGDLSRQIAEGLKGFEFDMRRQLAGRDPRRPQLPGSDEVAPEYRRMVEEYYRSLAGRPR